MFLLKCFFVNYQFIISVKNIGYKKEYVKIYFLSLNKNKPLHEYTFI